MKRNALFCTLALLILCSISPAISEAADSLTPAAETICDSWGFTGQVRGLCNAYCEAMDCDDANAQASDQACARVLDKILAALPEGVEFPTCEDFDNDGVPNGLDNCPEIANQDQADSDGDRTGDACSTNNGCPQGMALIDSQFCIDRWEASIDGQSPYLFPQPDENGTPRMAKSEAGVVPQGYINEIAAQEACQQAGKRLCTSAEWLRACRGSNDWTYPYGNDYQTDACNDYREEPPIVTLYSPNEPDWSDLDNPDINQLPDTVDLTGANTSCVTPEGVYDLVGNLHEWVDDPAGTFRGGFYVEAYINGDGCLYATTAHNVSHFDFSTGFRCCADAP